MDRRVGPAWAVNRENIFKFAKIKWQQKEVDKSALEKYQNNAIMGDPE